MPRAAFKVSHKSVTTPISSGITAPPETPVIIKPDTSFALSGKRVKAIE